MPMSPHSVPPGGGDISVSAANAEVPSGSAIPDISDAPPSGTKGMVDPLVPITNTQPTSAVDNRAAGKRPSTEGAKVVPHPKRT